MERKKITTKKNCIRHLLSNDFKEMLVPGNFSMDV
jgi:hypothetical protein